MMITNKNQLWQAALRYELELLRNCLELVQAKTGSLMRHDLAGLESSLVREAETMEQLGLAQRRCEELKVECGSKMSAQCVALAMEMSAVAREIQLANKTNSRLIQNGRRFCDVLYEIICPVQTYSPSLNVVSRPVEGPRRFNTRRRKRHGKFVCNARHWQKVIANASTRSASDE